MPTELGALDTGHGTNFAVWAPAAERVELCLFDSQNHAETERLALPEFIDGVWSGYMEGLRAGQLYGYRSHGRWSPADGLRFNPSKLLVDPWARQLAGQHRWHPSHRDSADGDANLTDSSAYSLKSVVTAAAKPRGSTLDRTRDDLVIYEAHVKGISQLNPRVDPADRGKFRGVASNAVVDHLVDLGVTAIELLPVFAFVDEQFLARKGLRNYWGYNPINWFAPHPEYGTPSDFQYMVERLHMAGIEVILDVVYNHSAEGGETGMHLNLKGLDNAGYYLLDCNQGGEYVNYTGCGNTLDARKPIVRRLILDSLIYWRQVMGVDGFRFDLASTLGRQGSVFDTAGEMLELIRHNEWLQGARMIAEPWDLGPDGYQAGSFAPRFAEWNDRFRDDIREFWLLGSKPPSVLANRLTGSRDRFHDYDIGPGASIQFICAHDGFSLADVVSYEHKHNEANGELNRDGHDHNRSTNCGVEGITEIAEVERCRAGKVRAMLTTLMVSQGTPMLQMGDEFGHSRRGNNNAYCQDNELNWLDWARIDRTLLDFVRRLTALRRNNPALRIRRWIDVGDPSIQWRKAEGRPMDHDAWHDELQPVFAAVIESDAGRNAALLMINATDHEKVFRLPPQDYLLEIDSSDSVQKLPIRLAAGSQWRVPPGSIQIGIRDPDEPDAEKLLRQGIQRQYEDTEGIIRCAPLTSVLAIRQILGSREPAESISKGKEDSGVCYLPEWAANGGQARGISLQLYAIRSERNWGIGDFEDLRWLGDRLAGLGVDFIAINPLHARFLARPEHRSPYSPTSRIALDPVYIAVDRVAEQFGFPLIPPESSLEKLRNTKFVDYAGITELKLATLFDIFTHFINHRNCSGARSDFYVFQERSTSWLEVYAASEEENLSESSPSWVARIETASLRLFLQWIQWIAHEQQQGAQRECLRQGMRIGLYRDLAVGPSLDGCEALSPAYTRKVEIGAPPDVYARDGQSWGIAPLNPLAESLDDQFHQLVSSNMDGAGALRIDHVMGLSRLLWIPRGMNASDGVYIRYPDSLAQIVASTSRNQECLVIGEDLGTLPAGFRHHMDASRILGLSVSLFERDGNRFVDPENYRRFSVTSFGTHDLPTVAGWWSGLDIEIKCRIGLIDSDQFAQLMHDRQQERRILSEQIGCTGVGGNLDEDVSLALHRWLGKSQSIMIQYQMDDLLMESEPVNLPGTVDEYRNWARKYKTSVEAIQWSDFQPLFVQ